MKTYYELYKFTAELHAQKLYKLTLEDIARHAIDNDEQPELLERFDTLADGLKALEQRKNSAFIAKGYGSRKWVDVEEYAIVESIYDGEDFDHTRDQWPCEKWVLDDNLEGANG